MGVPHWTAGNEQLLCGRKESRFPSLESVLVDWMLSAGQTAGVSDDAFI